MRSRTIVLPGLAITATLLACSAGPLPAPQAAAATSTAATPDLTPCDMARAFTATDTNAPGGKVAVFGPAANPAKGPALFAASLNVNTDGTSRSYSVDDPGGTDFALNNICNAMAGYCRELTAAGRQERFRLLREARDRQWPETLVAKTRLSPAVIPRRGSQICPEVTVGANRYLVSSTALENPEGGDACSLGRYVDALTVPALVLQGGSNGFTARGVKVGDAMVAWRPGLASPVYGVVGDTGPADRLGEGSIALNGALLGLSGEPKNYLKVRREYVVPKAYVIVFPGSRDPAHPRTDKDRAATAARDAFTAWGGGSATTALARLQACAAAR